MARKDLTAGRLRELLSYDPETGEFRWRVHRQCVRAGAVAGFDHTPLSSDELKYRRITIDGRQYYAHRLSWLYSHGKWPEHDIDHINGDGQDNRLENLRPVTVSQNMANMTKRKVSIGGARGVTKKGNRYVARVRVNKKLISLGSFSTSQDAALAAASGRSKYFGEYAR